MRAIPLKARDHDPDHGNADVRPCQVYRNDPVDTGRTQLLQLPLKAVVCRHSYFIMWKSADPIPDKALAASLIGRFLALAVTIPERTVAHACASSPQTNLGDLRGRGVAMSKVTCLRLTRFMISTLGWSRSHHESIGFALGS